MAVRTSSELSGLAVMTVTGGERVGRVHDTIFHAASGKVNGFLIDGGGLFARHKFLPAGQVRSIGADALTITDASALTENSPAQSDPDEMEAHSLEGRPVLNESGTAIGKVTGVLVHSEALTVAGFVIGTSILDNALHGRPTLPLALVRTIGKDSLVVPDSYDPKSPEYHTPTA